MPEIELDPIRAAMRLTDLTVRNFRNLELEGLSLHGGRTVILGANGVGKTSLLEAVTVLGNLRSFRTSNPRRFVRHGERRYRLEGRVDGGRGGRLEVDGEIGQPHRRALAIDGRRAELEEYLQILPCFALSGADRDLVYGPPQERRSLLDRLLFLLRPAYIDDLRSYRRALRQRNAALACGATDGEVAAWEAPLARTAARVLKARSLGAGILSELFTDVYPRLAGSSSPTIDVELRDEAWLTDGADDDEVEVLYQQRYNETRARDRHSGFTQDGPHRHDVILRSQGREARYLLSSGQAKVVAAALRLATLARVERERCELCPVIIDDVDAELDRGALDRLLRYLGGDRQILLSSTSEAVAEMAGRETQKIRLDNGTRVPQETSPNV